VGLKYREGKRGDKSIVPFEGVRMIACCDCGLVHKHIYSVEDKKVVVRTYRDDRATAGIRRAMAKRGDIVAERKANIYVIPRRIVRRRKSKRFTATYEPC
jgi:hypothetical protein